MSLTTPNKYRRLSSRGKRGGWLVLHRHILDLESDYLPCDTKDMGNADLLQSVCHINLWHTCTFSVPVKGSLAL